MGLYKYSMELVKGEKLGKAQLHDVNCSYKDLSQVFASIRGKSVKDAEKILEEAVSMKRAIPYAKFSTKIGHRSELGGRKGRYPKKECKIALDMIQNARSNAVQKGLDETALYVKQAAAYKQNVLKRYRNYFASSRTLGYGKNPIWSNYVTCWAELVLAESPEAAAASASASASKKAEAGAGGKKVEKTAEKTAVAVKAAEKPVEKPAEKNAEEKPAPKAEEKTVAKA